MNLPGTSSDGMLSMHSLLTFSLSCRPLVFRGLDPASRCCRRYSCFQWFEGRSHAQQVLVAVFPPGQTSIAVVAVCPRLGQWS